jgi:hypothetical protein
MIPTPVKAEDELYFSGVERFKVHGSRLVVANMFNEKE